MKRHIVRLLYWLLFIIVPTLIIGFAFRGTPFMMIIGGAALAAFILLGEKGYKEWKKLFKL